jgi:hypothetical protein
MKAVFKKLVIAVLLIGSQLLGYASVIGNRQSDDLSTIKIHSTKQKDNSSPYFLLDENLLPNSEEDFEQTQNKTYTLISHLISEKQGILLMTLKVIVCSDKPDKDNTPLFIRYSRIRI